MALLLLVLALTVMSFWLWKSKRTLRWGLQGVPAPSGSAYADFEPPPQFRLDSRNAFVAPDALPLKTRQYFFAPGESSFYAELVATLAGSPYRVFPNVRLDTIFQFTAQTPGCSLSRLHAQSVGFLVVEMPEFQPILGLMLENNTAGRTAVADDDRTEDPALVALAFRSARLPLLHIDAKRNIEADELYKLMAPHLLRS